MTTGVVTEQCQPYVSGTTQKTGKCQYRCSDASVEYVKYGCTKNSLRMKTSHTAIMEELYTNGPMFVGFVVYKDFMTYSSGIYTVTD